MSLERFQYNQPCDYQGLESYVPKEMEDYALELNRRLIENTNSLINSIRDQVLTDADILPDMNNGESQPLPTNLTTTTDLEEVKIFNILWEA